ncbi:MAG: hypothetical protein FWE27_01350 [Defluviitaleaceae bacterium]|nr:hypothetical protein [Defluviitaleaceae bacterium]
MDISLLKNFFSKSIKVSFFNVHYYIAAFFIPSIFLFNLYNRNRVLNRIEFCHILALAGLLTAVSFALFLLLRWVVKSVEGALFVDSLFWVCFWLFEAKHTAIMQYTNIISSMGYMVIIGLSLVLVSICFRQNKKRLDVIRPCFHTMAVVIIVMFFINAVPGINHARVIREGRRSAIYTDISALPYIKWGFNVDNNLPNPDIYWVHLDGMLSFSSVEKFFGRCQNHFREEFTQRGFIMHEDASLKAGQTASGLISLLSPALYDVYFGDIVEYAACRIRQPGVLGELGIFELQQSRSTQDGIDILSDLKPYSELFIAFLSAGYTIEIPLWFRHDMELLLAAKNSTPLTFINRFRNSDLPALLTLATPLNLAVEPRWISGTRQSYTISNNPSARLSFFEFKYTHGEKWYYPESSLAQTLPSGYHLYMAAHDYSINAVINLIDCILEQNPDTVIILQSDHGMHIPEIHLHLLDQGYVTDQVMELFFSVFSAVRIPYQYGGLEESLAPLNITRELVNRYVGENYILLSNELSAKP